MRIQFFVLVTFFSISQISVLNAQTEWNFHSTKGFDFIINTQVDNFEITGSTREDALKDYVGSFKFYVAKALTKIKYPEIVHFEGTFSDKSKTNFTGVYNYLTSEKKMSGFFFKDSIIILLYNNLNVQTEKLIGLKVNKTAVDNKYPQLVSDIINLTEKNIYDLKILQTSEWKNFKNTMLNNSNKIKDNLELQIGFISIAKDFPFSHYQLYKHQNEEEQEQENIFDLKEQSTKTAILSIKAFHGPRKYMDNLVRTIHNKKYENIIIDLRNNPGGDVESATPLMEYFTTKEITVGVFPNNKWYKENNNFPSTLDYKKFNTFSSGTLEEFYKVAANGYGVVLKCEPSKLHFTGKVYIITNKNTGSTAEVFALCMKENNLATLIGQTTAGGVLSAKRFQLNNDFDIFIPLNDYISFQGLRIDKKGVQPNIVVKAGEELNFIKSKYLLE